MKKPCFTTDYAGIMGIIHEESSRINGIIGQFSRIMRVLNGNIQSRFHPPQTLHTFMASSNGCDWRMAGLRHAN